MNTAADTVPGRETRNIDVSLYPAIWQVIADRAAVLGQTAETYLAHCIALDVPAGWRDSAVKYPHRRAARQR